MKSDICRPYISSFYRRNHLAFGAALGSAFLNTLLGFSITWILQEMLDAAVGVTGAMDLPGLLLGTLGVLGALILTKLIVYLSRPRFLKKAMVQFKDQVFRELMKKNPFSFQKESQSAYLSAFSADMKTIEDNYLEAQFLLIRNATEMTGALLMMLWYNPLMTAIAMGFLILPTAAAALQGSRLEDAETRVSRKNAGLLALLRDCLSGFSVIKSFGAESRMGNLMEEKIRDTEDAKLKKRKISTVLDSLGSLSALAAQLGTFLTGTALILSGVSMTPGVLVAFMDLTATFIDPVSELPSMIGNRRAARALIQSMARSLSENKPQGGEAAPEALTQGIRLDRVSYAYDENSLVLQEVSFHFAPGKSYAIVGASGCGKSTLLHLLMGRENYGGSIRYDDQELKNLSTESLSDLLSVIAQNVFIFNASIKDNITMFSDFPREEIRRAAELSGLSALMAEKGPHYLCGEDGCNLSGGEKQRISIARTLLRKSRVLLADEITAALDPETACQVSGAVLDLQDMLRIVVTHNLDGAVLPRFDCILAMKGGRILEYGTFRELMEKKGYFYSLYTVSQA